MYNINFRTLVFNAKGRNLVCSFFKTFDFVVFSLYKVILKNDRKAEFEISKYFFDELSLMLDSKLFKLQCTS